MNTNADDTSQSMDVNDADADLGGDVDLDVDDLAMDEEEFPVGTDIADLISMAHEFIDELSQFN